MVTDSEFINRCFTLAGLGLGKVAPNPLVGALLVYEGKIIGEGYHQNFGEPHAEVNAIKNAEMNFPELVSSATLYVNLEPCSHFGKTPPCADLIIQKKIKKVVISNLDPNPLVMGKGIQKLRNAGIEVVTDVLKEKGKNLNKRFFCFHEKHRPYIILKWAQTSDGFMAPLSGDRFQISGDDSLELTHKWRAEEQSILIGNKTALSDNPILNIRLWTGKNPIRIVIDSKLSLPENLHLFEKNIPTIVFNSKKNEEMENLSLIKLNFNEQVLNQILDHLYVKGISSVIVEGGAFTLTEFIKSNLWDEARIFSSLNKKLLNGKVAPQLSGKNVFEKNFSQDKLVILQNNI